MIKANPTTATPVQHAMSTEGWSVDHPLVREHGALVRQLASLQRRWGEQWGQLTAQQRQLDAEVVRLRGRLLQARTTLLWGLGARPGDATVHNSSSGQGQALPVSSCPGGTFRETDAVLCQAACAGHAHPWRTAEGLCQRTGDACRTNAEARSGGGAAEPHRLERCEASPPDISPPDSDRTRTCG